MKTVEEILSSGVIYSDKLKIGDDGIKGFGKSKYCEECGSRMRGDNK